LTQTTAYFSWWAEFFALSFLGFNFLMVFEGLWPTGLLEGFPPFELVLSLGQGNREYFSHSSPLSFLFLKLFTFPAAGFDPFFSSRFLLAVISIRACVGGSLMTS